MTWYEPLIIVAMCGYAIYKQTQRREQTGHGRFKIALIYGIVGLSVGGFTRPEGWSEVALFGFSLLLSVLIGLARGALTRVWMEPDGKVYSQGTALTISLFLLLVVVKFALGFIAYAYHVSDDGGFGEVLLMIAIMVAFQAEIQWQRAKVLMERAHDTTRPDQNATGASSL